MIINLNRLNKELFVGFDFGQNARKYFNLDSLDNQLNLIDIIIPEETYSISSSFVRGFLEESILKFDNKEQFYKKFNFKCKREFFLVIDCIVHRTFILKKMKIENNHNISFFKNIINKLLFIN